MVLFPIVERELRVAARQRKTYWTRAFVAGVFVLVLATVLWLNSGTGSFGSRDLFEMTAWLAFWFCLLAGPIKTADCVSQEKRDNTLGLLFLTDLRGYDIALGKLASSSLDAALGLLGILPVLAIPLLLGGVSPVEFGCTCLSLVNILFVSLSAGMFASILNVDGWRAMGLSVALVGLWSLGGPALSMLLEDYYKLPEAGRVAGWFSLFLQHEWAVARWRFAGNFFWHSLLATHLVGQAFLVASCLALPRTWREKSERAGRKTFFLKRWARKWRAWQLGQTPGGHRLRARLLDRNAWAWLAARERVGGLGWLLFILCGVAGAMAFLRAWFETGIWNGNDALAAFTFTWVWVVLAVHGIFLIKVAMTAARRFGEDRPSGALELALTTPLTVRSLLAGHWLALFRQTFGLILALLVTQLILFYVMLTLLGIHEMDGVGAWKVLLAVLRGDVWNGIRHVSEEVLILFLIPPAFTFTVLIHALTLGWLSAWLGLRFKHPRGAPWIALALVIFPPWPFFIAGTYILVELSFLWSNNDRTMFLAPLALALGLNLANDALLGGWAWRRLATRFRFTAAERFQPRQGWPWILRPRVLLRFAGAAALIAVLVGGFYRWERWRGERAWEAVMREAAVRNESLPFDSLMLPPVPPHEDMAQAPIFKPLTDFMRISGPYRAAEPKELKALRAINLSDWPASLAPSNLGTPRKRSAEPPGLGDWRRLARTDLPAWREFFLGDTNLHETIQALDAPLAVLKGLERFEQTLEAIREASQRPSARFPTNPRVSHAYAWHVELFRNIAQVLGFRAQALVAAGQTREALADIRTILKLGQVVGEGDLVWMQTYGGTIRALAIQPVWEGLVERRWSEPELAALQMMLGEVNVLENCPRAIRSEALRRIEAWDGWLRGLPDERMWTHGNGTQRFFMSRIYPAGWMLVNKAELYREIGPFLALVDVKERRVDCPEDDSKAPRMRGGPFEGVAMEGFGTLQALAEQQTQFHIAWVACALERHWLAHGEYPAELEALTPQFLEKLPREVITREPLRYRRTEDGRFILYSTGVNRKDDRGFNSHRGFDSQDWVWRYP